MNGELNVIRNKKLFNNFDNKLLKSYYLKIIVFDISKKFSYVLCGEWEKYFVF
jgi:hypothetical protein